MLTPEAESISLTTLAYAGSGVLVSVSIDRRCYKALAATWPVGPALLKAIDGAPKGNRELEGFFPDEDLPEILSRLEAVGLIEARLDEIKTPEQGRRLRKALSISSRPGPIVLRMISEAGRVVQPETVFPSDGLSAILFNLRATRPVNLDDFYFTLSPVGRLLLGKLNVPAEGGKTR